MQNSDEWGGSVENAWDKRSIIRIDKFAWKKSELAIKSATDLGPDTDLKEGGDSQELRWCYARHIL